MMSFYKRFLKGIFAVYKIQISINLSLLRVAERLPLRFFKIISMSKMTLQLITAFILTISGIVMLFMGLWIAPVGEIHNSVLVAFGEISTFAGALFGVDYTYKYHIKKNYVKKGDFKDGTDTSKIE